METKEVTQKEYLQIVFNTALAKSILANQYALHCNEVLKHSKYYKGRLKEVLRPCINILINAERKEFEKVDEVGTEKVDEIKEKATEKADEIKEKATEKIGEIKDELNKLPIKLK